ncbi:DUF4202 domain-containing protein [Colwellia sp. 4_MG-2023]|uniref:DUF4202 domain-containing protein n=1 Tax=unclassified Colwellia TaxID=196834 RepID=UPI001C09C76D|nr:MULTISPECIES: DUF4202 domain-containing protein [unclassified Colwellia]MBU2923221.1 DUF4202 domain-containing protein [Colwellia sp. C2M11]MDO6486624.1 DUF4202 domain-containing protein [Colwellia sp. 6_MG-2023]MDO6506694.1 DUF4202 domain-containing protein [Colwellia sp. 5_MG-2023]MDO6555520.1 DUF4202 domain-containing protein [Colwellia sp. 4_MG-2023]MDO6651349.1 DUF4202 domain-containing protein [Colwellia sp. 3_MG-2023]
MTNKLERVLSAIDDINRQDSNFTLLNNEKHPKELLYGQRMTACLNEHWPQASELLQIAVRAQHIKRWHLKRNEYEPGKAGYYKWRIALGKFHGELTASLMIEQGYSDLQAKQTASIICKENLKSKEDSQLNADSQTLEDVACLVFLVHYFDEFATQYIEQDNEAKIIRIVQLTWGKMSEKAHNIALQVALPKHLANIVNKALSA